MINKRRVLIIGLGNIGMLYDFNNNNPDIFLSHAKAINSIENYELIAGVDNNTELINLFKKRYKKKAYKSLGTALKKHIYDLIIISTSTNSHYSILNQIIKLQKPKIVLCEKPLSYNLKEAESMILKCKINNIKLFVNYMRRADPEVKILKKKIGPIRKDFFIKGICWYSKGLYNNGSHFINLLEMLLGKARDFEIINKGRLWNGIDPEPEFKISFQNSDIIFIPLWEEYFSHYSIELFSKYWRLNYEKGGEKINWSNICVNKEYKDEKIIEDFNYKNNINNNKLQLLSAKLLLKEMNNIKTSLCTGEQGLNTLRLIEKITSQLK